MRVGVLLVSLVEWEAGLWTAQMLLFRKSDHKGEKVTIVSRVSQRAAYALSFNFIGFPISP